MPSDPKQVGGSEAHPLITRRRLGLLAFGAVAAGLGALTLPYFAPSAGTLISAQEAFQRAAADKILLVDIRRPDEWQRTGIGQGAVPLDMRTRDFETRLDALVGSDRSRPVALICARGGRTARLARRLASAGFNNIIDVSEGMLGSSAGPGWVARGLPVYQPG